MAEPARSRVVYVTNDGTGRWLPWWCDCPDRKGAHVHMPNWDGDSRYGMLLTALVDIETGLEIPGSRSNERQGER